MVDPSTVLMASIVPGMNGIKLDTMTVFLGSVGILLTLLAFDKLSDALYIQGLDSKARERAFMSERTSEYRAEYRAKRQSGGSSGGSSGSTITVENLHVDDIYEGDQRQSSGAITYRPSGSTKDWNGKSKGSSTNWGSDAM